MTSEHYRRVLVVDDDADIRGLLLTALRMKSLQADTATNGQEAIDLLRQHSYGVVILDLFMPEIDGFAVLDMLGNEALQPVVLVVTGADQRTIGKLDARRIHGVVKKPFDVEELSSVVAACADVRGLRGFETMAIALPLLAAFLSSR
ncbi:MAG TPA: response regulator [Thermoanaerobaculia bacterium]|nr:response regulator [Thermoanaerobaculia bacterium]